MTVYVANDYTDVRCGEELRLACHVSFDEVASYPLFLETMARWLFPFDMVIMIALKKNARVFRCRCRCRRCGTVEGADSRCVFKLHESGTAYLVLKLCSSSMTIDNISRVHSMNERAVSTVNTCSTELRREEAS